MNTSISDTQAALERERERQDELWAFAVTGAKALGHAPRMVSRAALEAIDAACLTPQSLVHPSALRA